MLVGRQPADDPVVNRVQCPLAKAGGHADRRQLLDLHDAVGAAQHPAVRGKLARRQKDADTHAGRRLEPAHQLARQIGRHDHGIVADILHDSGAQRAGQQFGLQAHVLQLGNNQAAAVFIDIEDASHQHRQRQQVDRHDAQGQRRDQPFPAAAQPGFDLGGRQFVPLRTRRALRRRARGVPGYAPGGCLIRHRIAHFWHFWRRRLRRHRPVLSAHSLPVRRAIPPHRNGVQLSRYR